VSGERSLDRELRRLGIADLANHDDVRILPEEAAHPRGKGESGLRIDLNLINTDDLIFHGVFEVLPVSEKIGRLILERAPASRIEEQAVADGMVLMKQDGYLKALEGVTTIEEVLRVAEI